LHLILLLFAGTSVFSVFYPPVKCPGFKRAIFATD
jgi:hypothetical protein